MVQTKKVDVPIAESKEVKQDILQDNQEKQEKILILSIDRDDDIGQKIGVSGPIVGISKNLKVASDLAIADPEESDANCIFAAIKRYKELKDTASVEIATLTGNTKQNMYYADKNINLQLRQVLDLFPATGVVFVTDGAEDDQVLPIIQNYVPIISKETVIIKQAKHIESMFYTIKKTLQDPFFARTVLGVPAIILLLFVFVPKYAWEIIAFILGVFLLTKAFNLEKVFSRFFKDIKNRFSSITVSFPFYIALIFFMIFAIVETISLYSANPEFETLFRIVYVLRATLLYFALAFLSWIIGLIIDSFYFKKVYVLGNRIFSLFFVIIIFILIDYSLQLIIHNISFNFFITLIILSTIMLILLYKVTSVFDVTTKVTSLLIGLPVFSKYGLFLGEVVAIDDKKGTINYKDRISKSTKTLSKKRFHIVDGKIIV